MSILAGIGSLVDSWLAIPTKGQPPYCRHKSAAIDLSSRRMPITGTTEFLQASYTKIHRNWLTARKDGYFNPSKENWRWKRHLELSVANKSPELRLERAIVAACGENWSNQMPTASELVGPAIDKRAAVDLVFRESLTSYSLMELKVGSNTPLFAAIEILMYGLLLVWSKEHMEELGYEVQRQPVLGATTIMLGTLAPARYYSTYSLQNIGNSLSNGLAKFGENFGLELNFEFSKFGPAYSGGLDPEYVRTAVETRRPVLRIRDR
jgi:hypothetical protein